MTRIDTDDDIRRGDIVRYGNEPGHYAVHALHGRDGFVTADLVPASEYDRPAEHDMVGVRLDFLVLVETACTCHLHGALGGLHNNEFGDAPDVPVCRIPSTPEAKARRQAMHDSVDRSAREGLAERGVPQHVIDELLSHGEEWGHELNRSYNQRTIEEFSATPGS